jgi:hypothetical protein
VECPRCATTLPEVAHFCHACGNDLRAPEGRRTSFALKPDEQVTSFALVSTIMPRGAATQPQTYRLALEIALVLVAVTAIVGAVPVALAIAAFAIPVVYIVYLYDVNLWEDEPITVTAAAFLLTAVLGAVWTAVWLSLRPAGVVGGGLADRTDTPTLMGFLITGLLVPVVGEAIRQIGPLWLASRPKFDDLMDGLTFGVISGVAYATADTLVKHWALITGGMGTPADGSTILSLLVLEGFIKPLVLGTATGIACAEFSGLGQGYDGFTSRYFRGLGEAVLAAVLYFSGTYLLGFVGNPTVGLVLSVAYGLVILAVLIIRVRTVLQAGLMEAALENQARGAGVGATGELQFCARCEMPLLPAAAFCTACGTSVRVAGHTHVTAAPAAEATEGAQA